MKSLKRDKRTEAEKYLDARIEELAYMDDSKVLDEEVKDIQKILNVMNQRKGEKDVLSKDTIANIVANVGVTLLVLNYERLHVVTSKALQFAIRKRV